MSNPYLHGLSSFQSGLGERYETQGEAGAAALLLQVLSYYAIVAGGSSWDPATRTPFKYILEKLELAAPHAEQYDLYRFMRTQWASKLA
jgi:hypothetical protein